MDSKNAISRVCIEWFHIHGYQLSFFTAVGLLQHGNTWLSLSLLPPRAEITWQYVSATATTVEANPWLNGRQKVEEAITTRTADSYIHVTVSHSDALLFYPLIRRVNGLVRLSFPFVDFVLLVGG